MNLRIRLTIILCIFLGSCTVVPEGMKTADLLMETRPDSSLHILRALPPAVYRSGSNRALYNLLLIRAFDKNLMPLKPDSLLDFSINYYNSHHDNEHLATCYLYKGRMYKYALQYEKAMDYYLKALDAAGTKNNHVLLGRINLDMGDIYNTQNDFALARSNYRIAYYSFLDVNFQSQAFYCLLNIGRTYNAAKDYKNAEKYFQSMSSLPKDSLQLGALLQEEANNYYKYGKYDTALAYFRKVIRYPYIGNNRAIRYLNLADLYFDLNKIDSAFFYAKNALNYKPDIRTRRECYRILVNTVSLKGDLNALSQYMIRYQKCSDTIRIIDAQTKGSVLEVIHQVNNEVVKANTKLGYYFIVSILALLVLLLLYIRQLRLHRHEKLHAEQSVLQQKKDSRQEVISNYMEALYNRMDAIKAKQSVERKNASTLEIEKLNLQLFERVLQINDPDFFYREMDTLFNNLVSNLRERFPVISSKEIIWCCLNMLEVPKSEICLILDYKSSGLKKMKQRLAQKLNLPDAAGLDNFLMNMLYE